MYRHARLHSCKSKSLPLSTSSPQPASHRSYPLQNNIELIRTSFQASNFRKLYMLYPKTPHFASDAGSEKTRLGSRTWTRRSRTCSRGVSIRDPLLDSFERNFCLLPSPNFWKEDVHTRTFAAYCIPPYSNLGARHHAILHIALF